MKNKSWEKGVALLSLLSIASLGLAQQGAAKIDKHQNLEQRIEHVENGLLPAVVIKGEAPPRMRIDERMKFYKTPGVSVAVINEGKVEWARGYGVFRAAGQGRAPHTTTFQAASI